MQARILAFNFSLPNQGSRQQLVSHSRNSTCVQSNSIIVEKTVAPKYSTILEFSTIMDFSVVQVN